VKTIIHLILSDLDRNDLAKRIHRDADTKVLATRKEVIEHVQNFISQEIKDGREQVEEDEGLLFEEPRVNVMGSEDFTGATWEPSRGDEDYLAQPKDPGIAAACSRILDDTALIEAFAWDTVERNRSK